MKVTRYTHTCFSFSPFVIRFNTGNIEDLEDIEQITKYFNRIVKIDINSVQNS